MMDGKAGCRVGVISDTHGLLRPEVLNELKGCGVILHAGDIGGRKVLDELRKAAPVYAVRGNNDSDDQLPETLTVTLAGVTCFMIHDRSGLSEDMGDADVVIYGHSHRYEEYREGRRLWLNPGSCGPGRFALPVTMAVMDLENGRVSRVRRIDIPRRRMPGRGVSGRAEEGIPADIRARIRIVMKEVDRGRSVGEIAVKAGISQQLAEQICRLYVTHPGVDPDGIMRKMGL